MYHADAAMPAVLPTSDFTTQSVHDRDVRLLRHGWQLAATRSMLARPGDYVRMERLGLSVIVRNHDGVLVAVENVCAHRQCELVNQDRGHADELKCPYHGWCYGGDGQTRRIPAAKNFPHLDRQVHRLRVFEVREIGQCVFIRLTPSNDQTITVDDWSDWIDTWNDRLAVERWQPVLHDTLTYPCDWKVPVEGSIESYHLAEVHAATFGTDPGEDASTHDLRPSGTAFTTDLREPSFLATLEERSIRRMTGTFDAAYHHQHVFPNVMATFTDTMSLVYQIYPTRFGHSAMTLFGFVRRADRGGPIGKVMQSVLGVAARRMARAVLAEDAEIFVCVQAGMNAAGSRRRLFGRCEERLHAFETHWQRCTEISRTQVGLGGESNDGQEQCKA